MFRPLACVSSHLHEPEGWLVSWALTRWQATRAAVWGWRVGAAALVLALLNALGHVPWLGALLGFAVLLAGLGAMLLQWRRPALPTAA